MYQCFEPCKMIPMLGNVGKNYSQWICPGISILESGLPTGDLLATSAYHFHIPECTISTFSSSNIRCDLRDLQRVFTGNIMEL